MKQAEYILNPIAQKHAQIIVGDVVFVSINF